MKQPYAKHEDLDLLRLHLSMWMSPGLDYVRLDRKHEDPGYREFKALGPAAWQALQEIRQWREEQQKLGIPTGL